jgi:hypothetical protein
MPDQSQSNQSQSSQQPQTSSTTPEPQVPATAPPPAQPEGEQQQALPISPLTGEPYDPEWGAVIQKGGDSSQRTIQQVMKPEIERKAGQ